MARPIRDQERVRLNLAIAPEVKERLDALQARTHADSMAEVFRRALAVYDTLLSKHEQGWRVEVVGPDGERMLLEFAAS